LKVISRGNRVRQPNRGGGIRGDELGHFVSRADLLRVGRSGAGGIDGVISLDRLGLEK
jgi:restriction endonuclease Mrr